MPKITRDSFLDAAEAVWGLAQENWHKHGRVANYVYAFDAMGRQTVFLLEPASEAEKQRLLREQDIRVIDGTWDEHADEIKALFGERKVVSAILVGEAWSAEGDTGLDVLGMGLRPSEHPMSDEIIFVEALWPREYVAASGRAKVVRDDRGENPVLADAHWEVAGQDPGTLTLIGGWLVEALPEPPGRPSPPRPTNPAAPSGQR